MLCKTHYYTTSRESFGDKRSGFSFSVRLLTFCKWLRWIHVGIQAGNYFYGLVTSVDIFAGYCNSEYKRIWEGKDTLGNWSYTLIG